MATRAEPPELLTVAEMADADRRAVAAGVPSLVLMENAGRAVAEEAARMLPAGGRVIVLCGPGNNGGDGFVAARLLSERGFAVTVACTVPLAQLKGDAAEMARRWPGAVETLDPSRTLAAPCDLIIDALFGAGLSRPLDGTAAAATARLAHDGNRPSILAVDVPSGLHGDTGAALGPVIPAVRTVTFFRRKPGHLLLPGRRLCGDLVVADIAIPASVLDAIEPRTFANDPALWRQALPALLDSSHKYTRGHALVVSGPAHRTGAARLAARAALRIGAGLVTLVSPRDALSVNAAHLTAVMIEPFDPPGGLAAGLTDPRRNAILLGPALGVGSATRDMVETALQSTAAVVLDADALTSFENEPDKLWRLVADRPADQPHRDVVLTPHEGEFRRLFGDLPGSKLDRARSAARRSGAVVVLKGPDTVTAHPDGRASINANAPPWLATAGSGDVLAGLITGLLAQRMPAFDAASAAVWLHGACAERFGPGLIAEDIAEQLPAILRNLAASL